MKTPHAVRVTLCLLFVTSSAVSQEFIDVPVYDSVRVEESAAVVVSKPAVVVDPPDLRPVPKPQPERPVQPTPVVPVQSTRPTDPLDQLVDQAIEDTRNRLLVVVDAPGTQPNENTPWQIAHGVLALRQDYWIIVNGKQVKALDYIASGPVHNDKSWFLQTRWGGKGQPFTDKWQFEGHPNQFLAFFGTAGLPLDFEMITDTGEPMTIADWIRNAKKEINAKEEITWTLWAFSTYLDADERWVDQENRGWSIEKLVRMQIDVPPQKSACGGMHGLFAVANALNKYDETGERRRGIWLEADQHLRKHIAGIKSMQNRDGSFSANYLKGPEWERRDIDRRISTTGHTLEFLMNALPDSELRSAWVRRAVDRTARDLTMNKTRPLEPGGMYHACEALVIYRERTRPEFRRPIPSPRLADKPDEVKPSPESDRPTDVPVPTPPIEKEEPRPPQPENGDAKPSESMDPSVDLPKPVLPTSGVRAVLPPRRLVPHADPKPVPRADAPALEVVPGPVREK